MDMDKTLGAIRKPNFGPGVTVTHTDIESATPPKQAIANRKQVAEQLRALMGQPGERRLCVSLRTGWYPEQREEGLTLTDILEALEED